MQILKNSDCICGLYNRLVITIAHFKILLLFSQNFPCLYKNFTCIFLNRAILKNLNGTEGNESLYT